MHSDDNNPFRATAAAPSISDDVEDLAALVDDEQRRAPDEELRLADVVEVRG